MIARIFPLLATSFLLFSSSCEEIVEAPPDEVEEPEPLHALEGSRIKAIAVDPANEDIIYAGSYYSDDEGGYGLFKSTDGGASWYKTSAQDTCDEVTDIAIDPTDSDILYYSTAGSYTSRILKTIDGGQTWARSDSGASLEGHWGHFSDLAIDPLHPDTIYAGGWGAPRPIGDGALNRSTNGGASWEDLLKGTSLEGWGFKTIAIDPRNTQTIYAGIAQFSDAFKAFKSTDGGATWTELSLPAVTVRDLLVHPDRPEIVYAGTYHGVYVSRDGGDSWQEANAGITDPSLRVSEIVYKAPQNLYLAIRRGVYVSDSDTIQWSPLAENVLDEDNSAYSLAVTASGDILLGTGNGFYRFPAEIDTVNGP